MATTCSIPVIDLHDFPNQSSKLMAACEEWGCFRLLNHHEVLPSTLMSEMKSVVKSLFDLPVEIKCQNRDHSTGGGYMAPTAEQPFYEALGLYGMDISHSIETFCSQLHVSPYQRMNKYHFTPHSVGSIGVRTHTDSSFITILQDDEGVHGLEVMDKFGHFVPVDPWPGTIIINLGDMAKVWSNGRFCNVIHRVQCKEGTMRLSIASGLLGPRETIIEPPTELVDDDHPRVYVPTTYEDYRNLRFSTGLQAGEALALLLKPPISGN
ncbi:hypothetical protein OSB04_027529 [Centaurea solstitialis]|uniref:Fe2OG dioxygenase domain-containing protein n=1 Tax=Centaurea solstitialis TaxID=347529 RepID=A0AA38SLF2_9ASTR|nr:hypothetical protein OSB04_027529 [Centaurea solstitialis]